MGETFPWACRLSEEIAAEINCIRLAGNNIADTKGSVRSTELNIALIVIPQRNRYRLYIVPIL